MIFIKLVPLNFRQRGEVNIAVVCDAGEKRLAAAVQKCGAGVEVYRSPGHKED